MRNEIEEKLRIFLTEKNPLTEECHVVYLMVEIRKLLDQTNNTDYPLLRFYCDWSVHTEKEKITKEIRKIMEEINRSIPKDRESLSRGFLALYGQKVMEFFYMEKLKEEINKFLNFWGLPSEITNREERWISFLNSLIEVLTNQPIINPIKEIESFSYEQLIPGVSACCVIKFKDERNECRFINAF